MKVFQSVCMVGFFFAAQVACGAELYGQLRNVPNDASLTVTCGQFSNTPTLADNGTFRVPGIPANSTCSLQVRTTAGATSSPVWIPIRSAKVAFNATIRMSGSRIILLKD